MLTTPRIAARDHAITVASWARARTPSILQELLPLTAAPGVLSLALGMPSPELFPAEEYADALAATARQPLTLQYGPPASRLIEHIVAFMQRRGVICKVDDVLVTAGAQQGMSLLSRALLDPGGPVVAERLIYSGFRQVIEPLSPELRLWETHPGTGLDLEHVEWLLGRSPKPAFLYAIPDGHNPLATSLTIAERQGLAELAARHRVPIVEDDAYGFLQYESPPRPPIRSFDARWVCYVGSFSKILAPALRAGWIAAPAPLLPILSMLKEATDINTGTIAHRGLCAYLDRGTFGAHLDVLAPAYRVRRDAMVSALRRHFPSTARWHVPIGGVFVWVRLPGIPDTTRLLRVALETERVAFVPGAGFALDGGVSGADCMRLNFSHCRPSEIEDAIARLARAVEAYRS